MEHQVKSYKRRTKSGKIITVKAHTRKGKDGVPVSSSRVGRTRPKRHMSDELYYRMHKRDIDEMMDQAGGSLKDNIEQHKYYMKNIYPHEKDILATRSEVAAMRSGRTGSGGRAVRRRRR